MKLTEVVAPPPVAMPAASRVVVSPPPSAAQEVASGSVASQALATTHSVSSMRQSFAFDETRDGFDQFTLG